MNTNMRFDTWKFKILRFLKPWMAVRCRICCNVSSPLQDESSALPSFKHIHMTRIIKRVPLWWPCGGLLQTSSRVEKKKSCLRVIVIQMTLQFYKPLSRIKTSLHGIFWKNFYQNKFKQGLNLIKCIYKENAWFPKCEASRLENMLQVWIKLAARWREERNMNI